MAAMPFPCNVPGCFLLLAYAFPLNAPLNLIFISIYYEKSPSSNKKVLHQTKKVLHLKKVLWLKKSFLFLAYVIWITDKKSVIQILKSFNIMI